MQPKISGSGDASSLDNFSRGAPAARRDGVYDETEVVTAASSLSRSVTFHVVTGRSGENSGAVSETGRRAAGAGGEGGSGAPRLSEASWEEAETTASASATTAQRSRNDDALNQSVLLDSAVGKRTPPLAAAGGGGVVHGGIDNRTESDLDIPIPRPPLINIPKRQPPHPQGRVRRTVTPDGRHAWVLFSPRLVARETTDSVQGQSHVTEWSEKVVAPPPDHLPKRVIDCIAGGRSSAQGVSVRKETVLNRQKQSLMNEADNKNISRETKVPRHFSVSPSLGKDEARIYIDKNSHNNNENNNVEDDGGVWATLRRWLMRRDRTVNGKLLYTENEFIAAAQEQRNKLRAAADSLLSLLQPIRTSGTKCPSRLFPLPRGWPSSGSGLYSAMPTSGVMLPETLKSIGKTLSQTNSSKTISAINNNDDDDDASTVLFQTFSGSLHSQSAASSARNSAGSLRFIPTNTKIDVNEEDYVKAFFNLQPLPIHEANDTIAYMSFLYNSATTAPVAYSSRAASCCEPKRIEEEEVEDDQDGSKERYDNNDNDEGELTGRNTPERQKRKSVQSRATQLRQQERETAGRYGIWCTVEFLMRDTTLPATGSQDSPRFSANVRSNCKVQTEAQTPRWCVQMCGGALPRRYLSAPSLLEDSTDFKTDNDTIAPTVMAAHFEAIFFPQPPDDPLNIFGVRIMESAAASSTPPILSVPLTPQLLCPTEVAQYRRILMQQEKRILLTHKQEERFVFGEYDNREELFVLITLVTVNMTQRYTLDLNVCLMPCRRVRKDCKSFKKNAPIAELVEVPLFHTDTKITLTRRVHGTKLTFITKNAFLKAYQSLLWATEINITEVLHSTTGVPAYLGGTHGGESMYMALSCFASSTRKGVDCGLTEYRKECVKHVTSVLVQERDLFGNTSYRLDDFVLDTSSSRKGKRKPLSSAPILSLSPDTLSSAVAFDNYGAVYRAIHTPSSQIFDVRVLPRNRTRLLWADANAPGEGYAREGGVVSRATMEAALVMEYLSRMPYQNPIATVLCDAHKFYIAYAPIFSAFSLTKHHASIPSTPSSCPRDQGFAVISLQSFIENILRSRKISVSTRWELARLLAAQLLLALISLHGKGAVLGPCTPRKFFVRYIPAAAATCCGGDGHCDEDYKFTTRDFHLVIPDFSVYSDAWVYERQQPGVVEYVPPMYLFSVAYNTTLELSGDSEWTAGDDYWTYLCVLFELFSVTGEPLVPLCSLFKDQQKQQEGVQRPSAGIATPSKRKDIWDFWKSVFTEATPTSSSSSRLRTDAVNHGQSTPEQILCEFVESRVESSIMPYVEAWMMMEEHQDELPDGVFSSGDRATENENTHCSSGGVVSLTDAYVAALHTESSFGGSKKHGKRNGGSSTTDPAVAVAHAARMIQSIRTSMLTLKHICRILVGMSLVSSASCINKRTRCLARALLEHPFFIGIDFAKLFDGKMEVPHAEYLCKKLRSKKWMSGVQKMPTTKGNRSKRDLSLESRQQVQQRPSLSNAAGVHPLCIPLFSLPMEGEDEEYQQQQQLGGGGTCNDNNNNNDVVVAGGPSSSPSRSPRGGIYGIYNTSEIQEMRQLQEDVRRTVKSTSSSDKTFSSAFLYAGAKHEGEERRRIPYSQNSWSCDFVTAPEKNTLKKNEGGESTGHYTSAWKRLKRGAETAVTKTGAGGGRGTSAKNYDFHHVEYPMDYRLPTVPDPTGAYMKQTLPRSDSSHARALASADPLRHDDPEMEDCRSRMDGAEEFLQVASLQKKGQGAPPQLQSVLQNPENCFLFRGDKFADTPDQFDEGSKSVDVPGNEGGVVPFTKKEENEPQYDQYGISGSPKSCSTQGTRRPTSLLDNLTDNKAIVNTSGDFLIRVQVDSMKTVFSKNARMDSVRYKNMTSNDFMLVHSDGEEDYMKEKSEDKERSILSALMGIPPPVPRMSGISYHRYNTPVSYSSSTFKSSTYTMSALLPEGSQTKEEGAVQGYRNPDDIVWELVDDADEDEAVVGRW